MTFWDAPLVVPGVPGKGDSYPLPRDPSEVRRADCDIPFRQLQGQHGRRAICPSASPGCEMGIFAGDLQYTVYRGLQPAAAGSDR